MFLRIFGAFILAGFASISVCGQCLAREGDYTAVSGEFATGGLELSGQNYEMLEFGFTRGWDAKPWMEENLNFSPGGEWDYHTSYFVGFLHEPDSNLELQAAVGLRVGWPINDRWMPYVIGGTGPLLTTQNLIEQATDLNWGSYAGLGLEYRMDDESAVALQFSTRHFSNGSLKDPNSGVDTNAFTLRYLWYAE